MESVAETAPIMHKHTADNTELDPVIAKTASSINVKSPESIFEAIGSENEVQTVETQSYGDTVALEQEKPLVIKSAVKFFISDCVCYSADKIAIQLQPNDAPNVKPMKNETIPKKEFVEDTTKSKLVDSSQRQISEYSVLPGNKWRQFASVVPGLILFFAIGLQHTFATITLDQNTTNSVFSWNSSLGWNSGSKNAYIGHEIKTISKYSRQTLAMLLWFVCVIVGNTIAAILVHHLEKRTIYYICGLLQAANGVRMLQMFHVAYKDKDDLLIETLILSGIVFGVVHLTVTVHASDIASKGMRHVIAQSITFLSAISNVAYLVGVPYFCSNCAFVNYSRLFAMEMIAMALVAIIFNTMMTNETVPFLLTHRAESRAFKKIAKLNGHAESDTSGENTRKFKEMKLMVKEDELNGTNILRGGNFRPLILVMNARLLSLFYSNIPLSLVLAHAIAYTWPPIFSPTMYWIAEIQTIRIAVGILVLTLASYVGRDRFFYVSLTFFSVSCCALFATYAILYHSDSDILVKAMICTLFIGYWLLSYGSEVHQQIQTLDAFSITKKAWSVAVVNIIEQIGHMMLIVLYMYSFKWFIAIFVGIGLVIPTFLLAMMPDTWTLTLRETRNAYNPSFVHNSGVKTAEA